jgi:hypothetical protein
MIQIDDAGSGSLVGGTCIGLYWTKYKKYKYDFIPLDCYTPENFKEKKYQTCICQPKNGPYINRKLGQL